MNRNKYITVTRENIHLIAYRIKKFVERMEVIGMQSFYLDTQRKVKQFGKERFDVTESRVGFLSNEDYKLEVVLNYRGIINTDAPECFIRINFQKSTCGFTINTGTKIRITPTHIFLHAPLYDKKRAYPYEVWSMGNKNECDYQTEESYQYDKQYWEDYEIEMTSGMDRDSILLSELSED